MSGETVTQLNPPINVRTPWGWAMCVAWIHWGAENEPQWKCAPYDGERAGHVIDNPAEGHPVRAELLSPTHRGELAARAAGDDADGAGDGGRPHRTRAAPLVISW
jgi:hypothetical protein